MHKIKNKKTKYNKFERSVWSLISQSCFSVIEAVLKYYLIEGIKLLIKTILH